MENYKGNLSLLLVIILLISCDERFPISKSSNETYKEKLLFQDWQYQFVIMEGDTLRDVDFFSEPTGDPEVNTTILYSSILYNPNHSYEFRYSGPNARLYGDGENYQPNYGYWDFNQDEDTLIHNKLMSYETRYVFIELNDTLMIRQKVGGHYNKVDTSATFQQYVELIEVFKPSDN